VIGKTVDDPSISMFPDSLAGVAVGCAGGLVAVGATWVEVG
jgi:hypothetical protein